jgi:hypothetical protein
MANDQMGQHKMMAMGKGIRGAVSSTAKFARGGGVLKSGVPTTPLTDAKRSNGIPGMKKGGKSK